MESYAVPESRPAMYATPPPVSRPFVYAAPPPVSEVSRYESSSEIKGVAMGSNEEEHMFQTLEYNISFHDLKKGETYQFISQDYLTITKTVGGETSNVSMGYGKLIKKSDTRWGGGIAYFTNDDSSDKPKFEAKLKYPGIDVYPQRPEERNYFREVTGKNYEELTTLPGFHLLPKRGGRRSRRSRRTFRMSRRKSRRIIRR